jgi:hypothetical protein
MLETYYQRYIRWRRAHRPHRRPSSRPRRTRNGGSGRVEVSRVLPPPPPAQPRALTLWECCGEGGLTLCVRMRSGPGALPGHVGDANGHTQRHVAVHSLPQRSPVAARLWYLTPCLPAYSRVTAQSEVHLTSVSPSLSLSLLSHRRGHATALHPARPRVREDRQDLHHTPPRGTSGLDPARATCAARVLT